MTTAKEALLAAGRIDKIGRGRISLANHAWLQTEYDKGVRFSDWPKGKVVVSEPEVGPAVARVQRSEDDENYGDIIYSYPESSYRAVGKDGKEWGMREVCNTCHVSLVQCHCGNPTILGYIPVTIVAR